ncbi:MAG: hypothetical protein FWD64_07125 [Acidobacteriaceae bacterium]|nr:hypothetical protein [Acidobacteriaceae bacterium]
MFALIQSAWLHYLRSSEDAAAIAAGVVAIAVVLWILLHHRRPDADTLERARRERLAAVGRITDGAIVDAPPRVDEPEAARQLILYNYSIAGVSYEAAQDVTTLRERIRDLRTDLPVQVRYEPDNPVNSIVVSESWSGLRLGSAASQRILRTGLKREATDARRAY